MDEWAGRDLSGYLAFAQPQFCCWPVPSSEKRGSLDRDSGCWAMTAALAPAAPVPNGTDAANAYSWRYARPDPPGEVSLSPPKAVRPDHSQPRPGSSGLRMVRLWARPCTRRHR